MSHNSTNRKFDKLADKPNGTIYFTDDNSNIILHSILRLFDNFQKLNSRSSLKHRIVNDRFRFAVLSLSGFTAKRKPSTLFKPSYSRVQKAVYKPTRTRDNSEEHVFRNTYLTRETTARRGGEGRDGDTNLISK